MKSIVLFLLTFLSLISFAQERDSIFVGDFEDFRVDDYGNIYTYQNKDFSLTKYNENGKELARLMMTVPFKIQNIDNPLNIFLFSENSQELKVVDQNLSEIQNINFSSYFGFIKSAYAEDLQIVWLLDASTKRLIQFNYRLQQTIRTFPLEFDFEEVKSFLVYNNIIYIITNSEFKVLNFKGEILFRKEIRTPQKLKRSNDQIQIITSNEIYQFSFPTNFNSVYFEDNAKIVDKNSSTYFVLRENKGYIYTLKK